MSTPVPGEKNQFCFGGDTGAAAGGPAGTIPAGGGLTAPGSGPFGGAAFGGDPAVPEAGAASVFPGGVFATGGTGCPAAAPLPGALMGLGSTASCLSSSTSCHTNSTTKSVSGMGWLSSTLAGSTFAVFDLFFAASLLRPRVIGDPPMPIMVIPGGGPPRPVMPGICPLTAPAAPAALAAAAAGPFLYQSTLRVGRESAIVAHLMPIFRTGIITSVAPRALALNCGTSHWCRFLRNVLET